MVCLFLPTLAAGFARWGDQDLTEAGENTAGRNRLCRKNLSISDAQYLRD